MPHKKLQDAANRLELLLAGTSPDHWDLQALQAKSVDNFMNAEYVFAVQPKVGVKLKELLQSQAALHYQNIDYCFYCNPKTNPVNLPCPALELADVILAITKDHEKDYDQTTSRTPREDSQ